MTDQEEILRRRTFAIISHPDAGKTTLTEKILYHGGVIREAGEVKGKGGTKKARSDWMSMEQARGISITSSVMNFDHAGLRVNLLDTPGHKDFSEDTYRTLVAVDSAVMLIDVAKGVEERTKKLYDVCRYRQIPIFTFVNKLDREGKAPLELIDEIENTLQMTCSPVTWPIGIGDRFQGIYHRAKKQVILYDQRRDGDEVTVIPVKDFHQEDVKAAIRPDIYDMVLEELDLLEAALPEMDEKLFLDGQISPVTFGSAKQNFGVDLFLDLFAQYAPGPGPRSTVEGDLVQPTDNGMTGIIFKIQANMDKRHRDRVAFMRICSGKFERGMKVKNTRTGRELRLAYSNQFMAGDRETVDTAFAGDIVGLNDSGNVMIGDALSDSKKVEFLPIPKFAPELFARITVKDVMKKKNLQKGLEQLAQEGAIQIFVEPSIGFQDPIIGVVGELQFEVLMHRLTEEYNVLAALNRIPYSVARWPRDKDGNSVSELKGSFMLVHDMFKQPVILLGQEWDLNWAQKENPDIEFCQSITPAR